MSDDERSYGSDAPYMPTLWRGADGKGVVTQSPVVSPDTIDKRELEQVSERFDVCGECRYFELIHGQRLMKATRFVERLVREENWQTKHLCSPLNELGVCGAYSSGRSGSSEQITGKMHKACDQFRQSRGRFSLVKPRED